MNVSLHAGGSLTARVFAARAGTRMLHLLSSKGREGKGKILSAGHSVYIDVE